MKDQSGNEMNLKVVVNPSVMDTKGKVMKRKQRDIKDRSKDNKDVTIGG